MGVVSQLWCEQSVERGEIQDPLKYEVLDSELGGANGPFRSRISKVEGKLPILHGWEIMVMGEIPTIPNSAMAKLISFLGARFIADFNDFSSSAEYRKIVIIDVIADVSAKQARRLMKTKKLAVVDKEWLLETIGGWEIRPLIIHAPTDIEPVELSLCGYPSDLVGTLEE